MLNTCLYEKKNLVKNNVCLKYKREDYKIKPIFIFFYIFPLFLSFCKKHSMSKTNKNMHCKYKA